MSTSEGKLSLSCLANKVKAEKLWSSPGYTGQRMPGIRKRVRPHRRFMDVVVDDIQRFGVTEEDTGIG